MPGPVLPSAAVRGNEGYGGDGKCSPKGMPKDSRSPGRQVPPRYRSAMMECSPRSQKSGPRSPEKAKQTRRQRTAMLLADGTPKGTANGRMEHSRTAMLPASKSVATDSQDGTQSTGSMMSFVQGKVKGLVESVRHRT
mmetsp:Transcript_41207/g.50728  ORF Transcript_41207/g.50728 Transcript_41207/m.50728 type:complete len:138 (+) Transcript_41207:64-477(+)